MAFKFLIAILLLTSTLVARPSFAQDATMRANYKLIEKYMTALRSIAKKNSVANTADIEAALKGFDPPTTDHQFLADEAGMMANICTKRDNGNSTAQLIDCFRDTTDAIQFPEIKDAVKDCDKSGSQKNVEDCYAKAYLSIHEKYLALATQDAANDSKNSAQSCESRLATAEQKLELLDARISKSNTAKPQIEQIIQAIKTNAAPSASKAQ